MASYLPSARSVGVGAFVLGGILLFSLALFLIGNRRMLFSDSFTVYAEFRSISGVQVGSTVRVSGMNAGEIKGIHVPAGPTQPFRLEVQVREDLHPLVRTDSVASIQTEGLVGSQFLQIGTGSAAAPKVRDGGTIRSQEPYQVADLMQDMGATIKTINTTIGDLSGQVQQALASIQATAADADGVIKGVSTDLTAITQSGAVIARDARELVDGVRAGRGTVGRLMTDEALYKRLSAIVADAQQTMTTVREVADQAKGIVQGAGGEKGTVNALSGQLSDTLTKARASMDNLAEATEALKHNFLVRGFFDRRGYYSLATLSPLAYRQGALEKDGRRPLRVWLRADLLFTSSGEDGTEQLTDDGKARLDSAMGALLEYRKTGPLVVEGYAQAGDEAARYLGSRARADVVRNYLVSRFGLDYSSTAAVALGGDSKGSPRGAPWDGVALTLFVPVEKAGRE